MTNSKKAKMKKPRKKNAKASNSSKKLLLLMFSVITLFLLFSHADIPSDILSSLNDSWLKFVEVFEPSNESILDFLIALINSVGGLIYSYLEFLVKIAWRIPYLEIWALWTVGALVEIYYTSRPTVFSNVVVLILFFKEVEIGSPWIEKLLFLYIGFGILFAFIGLVDYVSKETSGSTYNDIAKVMYGSFSCGTIMLLVYLSPNIPHFLFLFL